MKIAPVALGILFCTLSAGASTADPDSATVKHVCLNATSVEGTAVIDDHTIVYRMRDRKVWKNTLRSSCPNLKFQQGFAEVVRSGEICANQQFITVLGTKNTCQLGDFTLTNPSPS